MNWRKLIPGLAKSEQPATPNTGTERPVVVPQKSRDELLQYWTAPDDGSNRPESYLSLENPKRSEYLVKTAREVVGPSAKILEVGCNVGRNLNFLFTNGFKNLSAIEISENAVRLLRENFPAMAASSTIHNSPLESVIRTFADRQFDFVFTMAVLEHIHTESEWTFQEISRVAGKSLFTYEDEGCQSWRHFPRNYQKIFEPLGWKQVREEAGEEAIGLGGGFVARLFTRA